MISWVGGYVGCSWSDVQDCFFWFREVQRNVFFIDVSDCLTLKTRRQEYSQWVEVEQPKEGDACWMTQNGQPHHIGVYTGQGVLHACRGQGVVHDNLDQLRLSGWTIKRYDRHVTRFK